MDKSKHFGACHLLLEGDRGLTIVDLGLLCEVPSYDATIAPWKRVELASLRCRGDRLDATLTVTDRDSGALKNTALRCRDPGPELSCTLPAGLPFEPPAEIAAFASRVEDAIDTGDWDALLELASRQHRDTQMGRMGQSRDVYLIELMSLSFVDHNLGAGTPAERLARITGLEITDIAITRRGTYELLGHVVLDDGRTRAASLQIALFDGEPALTGAVG